MKRNNDERQGISRDDESDLYLDLTVLVVVVVEKVDP